jgi:hypothetical protein
MWWSGDVMPHPTKKQEKLKNRTKTKMLEMIMRFFCFYCFYCFLCFFCSAGG